MNKTELIAQIARKQTHLSKKEVGFAVDLILKFIQHGLTISNRIEIRGFGTFTLRYRPSRLRINLRSGEEIISPSYHSLHFKPARELRLRVNASSKKAEKFIFKAYKVSPARSGFIVRNGQENWSKQVNRARV